MVIIDKSEFNKDLDNYLDKKREGPSGSDTLRSGALRLFSFFTKRIPSDDEVQAKQAARVAAKEREMEVMEEEIEEIHETEDVLETHREGIVYRFLKVLRLTGRKEYVDDEDLEEAIVEQRVIETEEMFKDTLKSLHKWLEELPPDKMEQFKRSEDFEKYKAALRKVGLIKN
ncbi:hypothetical protein K9M18_04130 [Candidatus Woesearchaeota archaeon]|nr:hypothetical protein [Candidatus Woesearchaeota archaeon]MCF8013504.1 hypothetical protein [Candidatus Woesearchaeota archaeon]